MLGVERQRRAGLKMCFGKQRVPASWRPASAAPCIVPATTRMRHAVLAQFGNVGRRGDGRRPAPSLRPSTGSATHNCRPCSGLAAVAVVGRGALGMHDAAPGRHPVDGAGPDRQRGAEAVAMHDLAVEQIGDGGEPDMRMRPHVDAVAGLEHRRAEMVEEDERVRPCASAPTAARDAPGSRRDRPSAARSAARRRRSRGRRRGGVFAGKKAHACPLLRCLR